MRFLASNGRMGANGDMLLGVLAAAGADPSVLSPAENALDATYRVHEVDKNDILATKVDVLLAEVDRGDPRDEGHGDDHRHLRADGDDGTGSNDGGDRDDTEHSHQHQYHHHDHARGEEQTHHDGNDSHGYSQGHDHNHPHSHDSHKHHYPHDDHACAGGHGPYRTYPEVVDLVESMNLPPGVVADVTTIFRVLGEVGAEVHGMDLDETHLHEVGTDNAIAGVVGVRPLLDNLGVDRVVTDPVAASGGEIEMNHGTYPVPTPAVVNITVVADWSAHGDPVEAELLTPTGVVILAYLVGDVEMLPPMSIGSSGYEASGWEFPDHPNALHAVIGDGGSRPARDGITVLETNLNDTPSETPGGLQAALKNAGARDVTITPTMTKESRPGHLAKVMVKPEGAERVAYRLAVETGTLGIRGHGVGHRWTIRREFETATLDINGDDYEVSAKVASDTDDVVYDRSAKYDDAFTVANGTGVPVRETIRRTVNAVMSEAGGTQL